MTDVSGSLMTEHGHHLSFLDRAATWVAWALAGTIFLTIGWFAMAPDDPLGAVSVLTRHGAWMMLLQAAGLAAVTAALATVIAGRRLPEVGTFAAAVGLAAVSLRGGTAGSLLIQWADAAPVSQSSLPMLLALEAMAWFVIVFMARGISIGVGHWCFGAYPEPRRDGSGGYAEGEPLSPRDGATHGIKHMLIAAGAALLTFKIISAGLSTRSVQHGQACFVVAASVCIGSYVAYWLVPVRSVLWAILSVPILAVGGYVWARLGPSPVSLPASVPASAFLRILPIQYIAVGTAAAVAMFWYLYHPVFESADQSHSSSSHASPEGRG
jgi:hypothetical protein